jgi:hypothetical protein
VWEELGNRQLELRYIEVALTFTFRGPCKTYRIAGFSEPFTLKAAEQTSRAHLSSFSLVGYDQRKRVKGWLTRCGDLTEAFRRLDTNGDGLISANELRVLADTGEIYQSTVKAIIALADTDNDGNISLAELLQLGTVLQENEKLKSELGVVDSDDSDGSDDSEQASAASILPRVREAVIAGFKDTYERRLRCHPSVHLS